MYLPYVDIHTHRAQTSADVLSVRNIIISKDDMPDGCCSAGIHPGYIDENIEQQLTALDSILTNETVFAVGECGLDKGCNTSWELQTHVFQQQIILAEKHKKPLIIHCVRAYQEVLPFLSKTKQAVVFHGFNKNIALAQQLIRQGHYISLGTAILQGQLDEHIRILPLEKIFLETDDKPLPIIDIYTYFCTVRKISLEQLQEQIKKNFEKVFKYVVK